GFAGISCEQLSGRMSEAEVLRNDFNWATIPHRSGGERFTACCLKRCVAISGRATEPLTLLGAASLTIFNFAPTASARTRAATLNLNWNAHVAAARVIGSAVHATGWRVGRVAAADAGSAAGAVPQTSCCWRPAGGSGAHATCVPIT